MKVFKLYLHIPLIVIMTFTLIFCSSPKKTITDDDYKFTEHDIKYLELRLGKGDNPEIGDKVKINLKIYNENGDILENTFASKRPISFTVQGIDSDKLEVIKGLEEGIMTMKQGGLRKLWIPPEMGFGSRTMKNFEPNTTLIVELELLEIN